MSIDQIASEALRLPARERALLAGSLWESLEDPFTTTKQMDEVAIVALAVGRDRQLETGQVQAVAHEEMMARLRRWAFVGSLCHETFMLISSTSEWKKGGDEDWLRHHEKCAFVLRPGRAILKNENLLRRQSK